MAARAAYVGDRYSGEDYALFAELQAHGCHFVVRLCEHAVLHVEEELAVDAADRAGADVRARGRGGQVRVVWVETPTAGTLRLATNLNLETLSAELVARVYPPPLADRVLLSLLSKACGAAGIGWPKARPGSAPSSIWRSSPQCCSSRLSDAGPMRACSSGSSFTRGGWPRWMNCWPACAARPTAWTRASPRGAKIPERGPKASAASPGRRLY